MAQQGEFGYLEGRIVRLSDDGTRAWVRLADGQEVEAAIGVVLPEEPGASLPPFAAGQRVELYYTLSPAGTVSYVISDWVRRPALMGFIALFLLVAIAVARLKGLRGFIATAVGLAIIIGFIVPRIVAGDNPVLISLIGVGGMLVVAIYFVQGFNWSTTAALLGTYAAACLTLLLGIGFSELAVLTGFGSDEAVMVSVGAAQVNLRGLLLAGLMIGALGALTDITIVQASVVRELAYVNRQLGLWQLYRRGMAVGSDHVGSLVNTLVLAYTGAALPLFLLIYLSAFSLSSALNLEIVAAEVVHTLVGSIGLILAVPLTTFIAAVLFRGDRLPLRRGELEAASHH